MFAPGGDLGGRSDPGDEPITGSGTDILPFLPIRDSRAPVITAVNGICQAGGLLIAMLSDICVASDRATFRVPELLRGIPDATYAAVLPADVGIAVARDLLLSARKLDAAEARRLGVISRVVPHDQLREAAITAAKEVLQTPPMTRMHVKRMLNERYGFIDYQTMFCAWRSPPILARACAPSWRSAPRPGSPRSSPRATAASNPGPGPIAPASPRPPARRNFAYSATTFMSVYEPFVHTGSM